jgi:integrase
MARKRDWGTGSIVTEKRGLAIRWSETVLGKDGSRRRRMAYEFLGDVSRQKAKQILAARIQKNRERNIAVDQGEPPTFKDHAKRWETDILPMYRYSVRVSYASILKNHLVPQFGAWLVSRIGPKDVQAWITGLRDRNYAPHSIHHYQEVLRVVMNEAVTWYNLPKNPALGVRLPQLKVKRPTFALTPEQAGVLIKSIPSLKVKAMVALTIVTSLRRGEVLAARWGRIDEGKSTIEVQEASYRGRLGPPKTDAGVRVNDLDPWTLGLLQDWRRQAQRTGPEDFVFGTRKGKIDNPSNILQRTIYPTCDRLGLPRVNFLTLRRTFSTMAHEKGIPAKTIAAIMGHTNVDTQLIYIQAPSDGMKRVAAGQIGTNLSRFCTDDQQRAFPWVN